MMLLIDVGNSRIKWATLNHDGELSAITAVSHHDFNALSAQWAALPPPDRIVIAQVGNSPQWQTAALWLKQHWPATQCEYLRSQAKQFGVTNSYQNPQSLGVDRWLALIAAYHVYGGNLCVVDCGTALTLDILDGCGQHLGGLIMPGLSLMRRALTQNTAALVDATETTAEPRLANLTRQAIANGSLLAIVGSIEATQKRLASSSRMVLTGGDAKIVASVLDMPCSLDEQLVFKGLALASQQGTTC